MKPTRLREGAEEMLVEWLRSFRWKSWLVDSTSLVTSWFVSVLLVGRYPVPDASRTQWAVIAGFFVPFTLLAGVFSKVYRPSFISGPRNEARALVKHMSLVNLMAFALLANLTVNIVDAIRFCIMPCVLAVVIALTVRWYAKDFLYTRNDSNMAERAIIYGAGEAGAQLIERLLSEKSAPYSPVGLLDDDPHKLHMRIRHLRCFGGIESLKSLADRVGAETVIVAIVTAESSVYRRAKSEAAAAGLTIKVLPPLETVLREGVAPRTVTNIAISDFLGRREVRTDTGGISTFFSGKVVLVTGAGGSIGSELCRQLSRFSLGNLLMLDRDESALHGLQLSLEGRALLDDSRALLADIRDSGALEYQFHKWKPDVVFHAAALKHLPLLETFPDEAWKSNVLGTANVLRAAESVQVSTFVNISTDKAANAVSSLGLSKRIAERLTASMRMPDARYLSVRFGNVLGSRGSVMTTFSEQIASGGPVTVTHQDVTRFFMTIPEAVVLTLQAAVLGNSGESLVLDMGAPVKIVDLARQMIDAAQAEVSLEFTGLRPGEKLREDLFDDSESSFETEHPLIRAVKVPPLSLNALDTALTAEHGLLELAYLDEVVEITRPRNKNMLR